MAKYDQTLIFSSVIENNTFILVFDTVEQNIIATLEQANANNVILSPNGSHILALSESEEASEVWLWDVSTDFSSYSNDIIFSTSDNQIIYDVGYNADGSYVFIITQSLTSFDSSLTMHNVELNEQIIAVANVNSVNLTSDYSDIIRMATNPDTIQFIDTRTSLHYLVEGIVALRSINSNNDIVVSSSEVGDVFIDITSNEELITLDGIQFSQFSPNGNILVSLDIPNSSYVIRAISEDD